MIGIFELNQMLNICVIFNMIHLNFFELIIKFMDLLLPLLNMKILFLIFWPTVESFMKKHPELLHPNNAIEFLTSKEISLNHYMDLILQQLIIIFVILVEF